MMNVKFTIVPFVLAVQVLSKTVIVDTTSGRLLGTQTQGVASFKGIRFAHPPIDELRWAPPMEFASHDIHDATSLQPSCIQQFPFQGHYTTERYNTPAPQEDEDCLFLNVWTPAPISSSLKPVIVWFYGGGYTFGTASLPMYDGRSFAKNQDVVFVSFNYRTNVFGFPTASELPASRNNLGFLDQELALAWVRDNIAKFGGNKSEVTLMGHSAGAESVSLAIVRQNSTVVPPFRAAIMLSGVRLSTLPELDFSNFDAFASAVGCKMRPGPPRLQCLRGVSASAIHAYTNGPNSGLFVPGVDNVTVLSDPLQRIRTHSAPRVPILLGSTEDDGSVFGSIFPNVPAFLAYQFGSLGNSFHPPDVQKLYPGLNSTQLLATVIGDVWFLCPAKLWSDAFVTSGIKSVYRYSYGPDFKLQPFPDLGAWHGSELTILFGTFNRSTAATAEVKLSYSLQTAFANFVKDPGNASPVPRWPQYEPDLSGDGTASTLAKIAYRGNVGLNSFVEPVEPHSMDGSCPQWDPFLDFRP